MTSFSKKTAFLLFVLVSFLIFGGKTLAVLQPPDIRVQNLFLSKTLLSNQERINGSFEIWNKDSFTAGDILYKIEIQRLLEEERRIILVDENVPDKRFTLQPDGKIEENFSYLPEGLPDGKYIFTIALYQKSGEIISWQEEDIEIKNKESVSFVWLTKPKMFLNGQEFSPGVGPVHSSEQPPLIGFTAENISEKVLELEPKVSVSRRDKEFGLLQSYSLEKIVLQPGEKKELKYQLQIIKDPAVYVAYLHLENPNGAKISNELSFRWIISGGNADILSLALDRSCYSNGETANVNLTYVGSADINFSNGKGILEVKILNEEDETIGTDQKEIDLDTPQNLTIPVNIHKDACGLKTVALITKEGKNLANYETSFGVKTEEKSQEKMQKTTVSPYQAYLMLGGAVVILLIAGVYFLKKRNFNDSTNLT